MVLRQLIRRAIFTFVQFIERKEHYFRLMEKFMGIGSLHHSSRTCTPKRLIFAESRTIEIRHQMRSLFTNSAWRVLPSEAGLLSTMTPAASRAAILESAPPFPPLTIAPTNTHQYQITIFPLMRKAYPHDPFSSLAALKCPQ